MIRPPLGGKAQTLPASVLSPLPAAASKAPPFKTPASPPLPVSLPCRGHRQAPLPTVRILARTPPRRRWWSRVTVTEGDCPGGPRVWQSSREDPAPLLGKDSGFGGKPNSTPSRKAQRNVKPTSGPGLRPPPVRFEVAESRSGPDRIRTRQSGRRSPSPSLRLRVSGFRGGARGAPCPPLRRTERTADGEHW